MRRAAAVALMLLAGAACWAEWNNIKNLKVAVLDLQSRVEKETLDTATLSEMLLANLVDKNAFQIVERNLIRRIIDEQQFQLSAFTEKEIARIGSLAGANKIVTGSISKIGGIYFVIVKGIDTSTGVIDLSDQVSSRSVEGLLAVFPILADRLVRKAQGESVAAYRMDEAAATSVLSIAREYSVLGRNPDGSQYRGIARISESGGTYTMKWEIGTQSFEGRGRREGDTLTIDWGSDSPVIYTIKPDGRLNGVWARGQASEELTPR
jgi:hypothetical protein